MRVRQRVLAQFGAAARVQSSQLVISVRIQLGENQAIVASGGFCSSCELCLARSSSCGITR